MLGDAHDNEPGKKAPMLSNLSIFLVLGVCARVLCPPFQSQHIRIFPIGVIAPKDQTRRLIFTSRILLHIILVSLAIPIIIFVFRIPQILSSCPCLVADELHDRFLVPVFFIVLFYVSSIQFYPQPVPVRVGMRLRVTESLPFCVQVATSLDSQVTGYRKCAFQGIAARIFIYDTLDRTY